MTDTPQGPSQVRSPGDPMTTTTTLPTVDTDEQRGQSEPDADSGRTDSTESDADAQSALGQSDEDRSTVDSADSVGEPRRETGPAEPPDRPTPTDARPSSDAVGGPAARPEATPLPPRQRSEQDTTAIPIPVEPNVGRTPNGPAPGGLAAALGGGLPSSAPRPGNPAPPLAGRQETAANRPRQPEPNTAEIMGAFGPTGGRTQMSTPPQAPVSPPVMPPNAAGGTGGPGGPVPRATAAPRRGGSGRKANRGPRRAHLQLKHIDVWSVLKFSCVLAFSLFFVWLIVVAVLYGVLDVSGVVGKINDTAQKLNDNSKDVVSPGLVLGGALVIGVINIVLFIVLSTIGSVVYNLCSDLVGGIEVTLSERE